MERTLLPACPRVAAQDSYQGRTSVLPPPASTSNRLQPPRLPHNASHPKFPLPSPPTQGKKEPNCEGVAATPWPLFATDAQPFSRFVLEAGF